MKKLLIIDEQKDFIDGNTEITEMMNMIIVAIQDKHD